MRAGVWRRLSSLSDCVSSLFEIGGVQLSDDDDAVVSCALPVAAYEVDYVVAIAEYITLGKYSSLLYEDADTVAHMAGRIGVADLLLYGAYALEERWFKSLHSIIDDQDVRWNYFMLCMEFHTVQDHGSSKRPSWWRPLPTMEALQFENCMSNHPETWRPEGSGSPLAISDDCIRRREYQLRSLSEVKDELRKFMPDFPWLSKNPSSGGVVLAGDAVLRMMVDTFVDVYDMYVVEPNPATSCMGNNGMPDEYWVMTMVELSRVSKVVPCASYKDGIIRMAIDTRDPVEEEHWNEEVPNPDCKSVGGRIHVEMHNELRRTLRDVVAMMPTDSLRLVWDGNELYCHETTVFSWRNRVNIVNPHVQRNLSALWHAHQSELGFVPALPGLHSQTPLPVGHVGNRGVSATKWSDWMGTSYNMDLICYLKCGFDKESECTDFGEREHRCIHVQPSRRVLMLPSQTPEFRWIRNRMRTGDGYMRYQTYTSPYMWLPMPAFINGYVVSDILMKREEAICLVKSIYQGMASIRMHGKCRMTSADVYSRTDLWTLFIPGKSNTHPWRLYDSASVSYTSPFIEPVYDFSLAPWLMYCKLPLVREVEDRGGADIRVSITRAVDETRKSYRRFNPSQMPCDNPTMAGVAMLCSCLGDKALYYGIPTTLSRPEIDDTDVDDYYDMYPDGWVVDISAPAKPPTGGIWQYIERMDMKSSTCDWRESLVELLGIPPSSADSERSEMKGVFLSRLHTATVEGRIHPALSHMCMP